MEAQSLYMAMELGDRWWKLAFGTGEQSARQVSVAARDTQGTIKAIERAKAKLNLPAETRVKSCYEAGRDGFWIHRFLQTISVENLVVDAASIEVPRRKRRAKTDRLDAAKLLKMLMRYWAGEKDVWGVARVPSEAEEDERRLNRELQRMKKERTAHYCRMKSLLVLVGLRVQYIKGLRGHLGRIRTWDDKLLPVGIREELERECLRLEVVQEQIDGLLKRQITQVKDPETEGDRKAQKLHELRGIGPISATILGKEFFGWRDFKNRREVAALAGLTPTPYDSGESRWDQGISKTGSKRIRAVMVELSWNWLKYQPDSELSKWFVERYSHGKRLRKVGIVALARKLLVALWKYVDHSEVPAGAVLKIG